MGSVLNMIDLDEKKGFAHGSAVMAVTGVATHLLFFIHGDHNRYAHRWIMRAFVGTASLALVLLHLTRYHFWHAAVLSTVFALSYFIGLYGSISFYRLFLHSLRSFPGPFSARLSNLFHMYMIRKSDNYLVMQKLHEKYGPFVRTGKSRWHV